MNAGDKVKVIGDRYRSYQGVIDHISTRNIQKEYPVIVFFGQDEQGFLAGFAESELELLDEVSQ